MNAYKENEYVSPLKIRSYADRKSNLNSHVNAAAIDTVIRLTNQKKKKKKKKACFFFCFVFFEEYILEILLRGEF